MKNLFRISLAVVLFSVLISTFTGCKGEGKNNSKSKVVLNVYNWGDYIEETVIESFKKEYGIKVNYETFTTNEDMYVKIKSGAGDYDVAIPSDYMIKRMISENLLKKINFDNIPNYKYIEDRFKNLAFDPNNEYSVPYMWGTVGILYNTTMVDEPVDSWNILWDKKYEKQIFMLDSQRDSLGVALKKLGYSMNTRNLNELEEAKKALLEQKPLVLAYVVDEVKDKMIAGEGALAVVWSGDAFYCISENPDLAYAIPKEGSNLWFDSMVIPVTSKNQKEAEMFINFMCESEVAYKNADYIGYATPHSEAKKMLDPEVVNNRAFYPLEEDLVNFEIFEYDAEAMKDYDRIWTEITSE